jgi:integrase/recombinase XerC
MTSTALIPGLPADALGQALSWVQLSLDERKRRATAAAATHDLGALIALADAYLTIRGGAGARVSDHTRRVYSTGVRLLVDAWREENLLHPNHDAGAAWVRQIEHAGASASTVRVRLAAARLFYRALRWAKATGADPFADTQAATDKTSPWEKRHPYTPDELAALLAAARPRDRVMVLLGAHAGLRVAEACALTWGDIDLAVGELTVQAGKGGRRRCVVLSASLKEALRALPAAPDVRVLPITEGVARERMAKLATRAGVQYRGYHALRHAAGTRAAREGLGLDGIAAFLGHANVQTTRAYQHWADESVRALVGAW